jgi:hypothetical protein
VHYTDSITRTEFTLIVVQTEEDLERVVEKVCEAVMRRAPHAGGSGAVDYMSQAAAAVKADASASTIASWIRKGLLPVHGNGKVRWSEVEALMSSGKLRRKRKDEESRADAIFNRTKKR